jgi:four helix bundle protein
MAKTVDDLMVYAKALDAAVAVFAIIQSGRFHDDHDLHWQLNKGSRRVPSDIAEGFEQKTDRRFAHYLYIARGAAREICTQVRIAERRHLVTETERTDIWNRYDEIARMLTGLIRYLEDSDCDDRC